MSKNTRWSIDDLKKKGLVEKDGLYVPVKSLSPTGKVDKIEPSVTTFQQKEIERVSARQNKDLELALGMAIHAQQRTIGIDPFDPESYSKGCIVKTEIKDGKLVQELIDISKFYDCKIRVEKRTIKIKPMSVNSCWQGKRYKTPQYNMYAHAVSLLLPNDLIVPEGLLRVYYEFGLSSSAGDWDNPVKPFQDILQAKYGFNDSRIMEATVRKVIVKKGHEYISFKIESL